MINATNWKELKKQKIPIGQMKMLKVKQWQIGLVVS